MRFLVIVIALLNVQLIAQQKEIDLNQLFNEIFPVQDEDIDYSELYDLYAQLVSNPYNLNAVTEEQLRSLLILSPIQIKDFLQYRDSNSPIISIYELQSIPSFDEKTIRTIKPLISVSQSQNNQWNGLLRRIISEKNNYLIIRGERTIEEKIGYTDKSTPTTHYTGSPIKTYSRFRVSRSGDFSLGFTFENDAGERIKWTPRQRQYGFDYYSYHAQVQNKGIINNLILGDFQTLFGQGITLGGGFGLNKGAETITSIRRSNLGFIPYTSLQEFNYLRGIAISLKINPTIQLHGFVSRKFIDGTIQNDSSQTISSFPISGLHRTLNEIEKRKNIEEINYGSVIQYKTLNSDIGLIFHHIEYSTPVIRTKNIYNQYAFSGTKNSNIGFYLNQTINNFSFFSELSKSLTAGHAINAGFLSSLSSKFDLSFIYRKYTKDFYSFYSNSFSENSFPQNEEGVYWGWKFKPTKYQQLSGYFDLFKFPWLKFGTYKPSIGSEWLIRYSLSSKKSYQVWFQLRQEIKEKNTSSNSNFYLIEKYIKTNYWVNLDYSITPSIKSKTKIQWIEYKISNVKSNGFMIVQDVDLNLNRIGIKGRVALFHTANYDTRLYTYENDVWLNFSVPAFQGIGVRQYILVNYAISKKVDLWVKWSRTVYEDQDTIGSSGELINSNQKNDLKAQLRIKF